MSQTFARVELRGCKSSAPYEHLHELMKEWGWSRTVAVGSNVELLPNDVYVGDSDRSPEELSAGICNDIELYVWKPTMVFVAESTSWSVSPGGLDLRR